MIAHQSHCHPAAGADSQFLPDVLRDGDLTFACNRNAVHAHLAVYHVARMIGLKIRISNPMVKLPLSFEWQICRHRNEAFARIHVQAPRVFGQLGTVARTLANLDLGSGRQAKTLDQLRRPIVLFRVHSTWVHDTCFRAPCRLTRPQRCVAARW